LYVTVEDETPRLYWSMNASVNCEYLKQLHKFSYQHDPPFQLGIYTTWLDWSNIMEDGTAGRCEYPFYTLPLWVPKFDSTASMDFFAPFAGWTVPFMKQITGGSREMRRIGSNRISYNYIQMSENTFDNSSVPVAPL